MAPDQYDLVIVGLGAAGAVAAEFATTLELRVAAVERGRIGGRTRWCGPIPSKALLASARTAHRMRHADLVGLEPVEPAIDLARVWARVREVRDTVARDASERLRLDELGLELVHGDAVLTGPNEVTVRTADGDRILQTRFVLLCTGSEPVVPDLPGIDTVPVLTDDTLFDVEDPPTSAIVLGGGPAGVELAQAFQRLGITTTLVERGPQLLARDEPALVAALTRVLSGEGVDVLTDAEPIDVRPATHGGTQGVALRVRSGGVTRELTAAALVVTAGRRPAIDGLGLGELGIETTPAGIVVDERARTTFRSVYAVGDATDGERFTHAAEHAAGRAVRDMFFPGRAPIAELVPWCTFTDPELAHAGLTIAEAEARHGDDVDVWRVDLDHNDRLRTDAAGGGTIVVVTAKDRIVGAHVLAPGAGEIIHELALAIDRRLDIDDLAGLVHVHPTVSTGIGMLAAESLSEKAQRYRWLVRRR